jgi:hypothetical protein
VRVDPELLKPEPVVVEDTICIETESDKIPIIPVPHIAKRCVSVTPEEITIAPVVTE